MVKKGHSFKNKSGKGGKYYGVNANVKKGKATTVKKHSRKGKSVVSHKRSGAVSHTRKVYRERKATKARKKK